MMAQQVLAAVLDRAQLPVLLGVERARQFHEQRAGEADDRVQRRAQLVAHAGQEHVLRPAGLLQFDVLLAQLLLGPVRSVTSRVFSTSAATVGSASRFVTAVSRRGSAVGVPESALDRGCRRSVPPTPAQR